MFIKKIEIKNFKNISSKGLTINCNDGLNCFIGKNGAGKSSVFEAINCLFEASKDIEQSKELFRKNFLISSNAIQQENINGNRYTLIEVSFDDNSSLYLKISFPKNIQFAPYNYIKSALDNIPAEYEFYCSHLINQKQCCELCSDKMKNIRMITADRIYKEKIDTNTSGNMLASESQNEIGRLKGITGQKFHYQNKYDDRFLVKDDGLNYDNIGGWKDEFGIMMPMDKDKNISQPSVDISNESHGIRNDAILSNELRRNRSWKVIFIDEPELYLHPQAKKALFRTFEDLSKQGIQIFYITHSSEFLSYENPENIHLFKNENGVEVFKGDQNCRMENSLMEKIELNNAFFAENLIVVEGKTDKKVITEIIKRNYNGKIPEDFDITVIDCGGKDELPKIFDLYKKFNKKIFFLLDYDIRNNQRSLHNQLFKRLGELVNFDVIFPSSDQDIKGKFFANNIENELYKFFIFKDAIETFFGYDYKDEKEKFKEEEIFKDNFYETKKDLCDKIHDELKNFFVFL